MKRKVYGEGPRKNLTAIDDFLYEIDELNLCNKMPEHLVALFEQAKYACAYLDGFIELGKKNG